MNDLELQSYSHWGMFPGPQPQPQVFPVPRGWEIDWGPDNPMKDVEWLRPDGVIPLRRKARSRAWTRMIDAIARGHLTA